MPTILDISALRAALLYTAVMLLLLVFLTVQVILRRRAKQIGIGDGGDRELARWVRVHGNFAENAPFGALALFALAFSGAGPWLTHGVGLAFVAGRIAHAQGLSSSVGYSAGRAAGMVLTMTPLTFAALVVLWRVAAG